MNNKESLEWNCFHNYKFSSYHGHFKQKSMVDTHETNKNARSSWVVYCIMLRFDKNVLWMYSADLSSPTYRECNTLTRDDQLAGF